MKTTLLSVDFSRTGSEEGSTTSHIEYTLRKSTPMGEIVTKLTITHAQFIKDGPAVSDGQAFFSLGEKASREESNLLLEMGASDHFGSAEAA